MDVFIDMAKATRVFVVRLTLLGKSVQKVLANSPVSIRIYDS